MKMKVRVLMVACLIAVQAGSAEGQKRESETRDSLRNAQELAGARLSPLFGATSDSIPGRRTAGPDGMVPRTRWQGTVRGAKVGALLGGSLTGVLSGIALASDIRQGREGYFLPATPFVLAFGVVGTVGLTVAGAGIGLVAPGWHVAR